VAAALDADGVGGEGFEGAVEVGAIDGGEAEGVCGGGRLDALGEVDAVEGVQEEGEGGLEVGGFPEELALGGGVDFAGEDVAVFPAEFPLKGVRRRGGGGILGEGGVKQPEGGEEVGGSEEEARGEPWVRSAHRS
jgi:hypothetical protein